MLDMTAALDLLHTGKWVSLAYVGADSKRGRYGEIIRIKRCRLHTVVPATVKNTKPVSAPKEATTKTDPNHDEHFTRNVILANHQIRKIHFRLLFSINGQKII